MSFEKSDILQINIICIIDLQIQVVNVEQCVDFKKNINTQQSREFAFKKF